MTNRRNNRRVRRPRKYVTPSMLRVHLRGKELKVSPDPPSIVANPWNHATIVVGQTGDLDVTISSLWSVLATQLGLVYNSGGTVYPISGYARFQKLRVWTLNNSKAIVLSVYHPETDLLTTLEDWPSQNHFPAVGYVWPNDVQILPAYSTSNSKLFHVDVGGSAPWIAYVELLWRGLPTTVSSSERLQRPLLPGRQIFNRGFQSSSSSIEDLTRQVDLL